MPARFRFTPAAIPPNPAPTTTTRGVPAGPNRSSAVGFTRRYASDFDVDVTICAGLRQGSGAMGEFETVNFFKDRAIHDDPYGYYDWLRGQSPVWREPHYGVFMVTGFEEAIAVYHDPGTFSSCNTVSGPFVKFPVPLEGDDISEIIETYRDQLPFSDQLPSFDPPKHTAHRALLMRLITPKRLNENEEFMWRLADRQIGEFYAKGECEFISEYAGPFTLLVIADLEGVPESDFGAFRSRLGNLVGGEMSHKPLEFL